jgi:endonuclease YncB( thermonuclease family)
MGAPARAPTRRTLITALFFVSAWGSAPVQAQNPQTVRVRGAIMSLDGNTLVVKSREGETVPIRLADTWSVSGIVRASLADIKPGTYIGTAAMPQQDGSLRALEVLIFPEAMRGAGEGHSRWDLLPDSTMTNATVSEAVQAVDGQTLTLTYKGEQKRVSVPPDAPIVTLVPAQKTDVTTGAPVFISTQRQPDGTLTAARVTVGPNGVAPPM